MSDKETTKRDKELETFRWDMSGDPKIRQWELEAWKRKQEKERLLK